MSTNPAKGYYSILQFVPDLEKSEGANIGVVLFCPDKQFLKAQTSTGNDRVRRFFGPETDVELDLDRINAFKATFEERLTLEASRLTTPEDFLQFVNISKRSCTRNAEHKNRRLDSGSLLVIDFVTSRLCG